ncbi:hypothetical protein LJ655_23995 [Paraburkholderia sp. MMS20-SJTN17]|uniref:DUF4156 domain-containing protein n=1 Tax=Paraburkholderia translucens TaxID=2886945 RepID=A0ABS8KJM1_9BURK|nr:hypothetical protein [Paraburkholderia sp. MMS20-SJTN17]MCC8404897.1 hypothetical protein [Paraburkholderia sp. MMS20-SJTN17]
MSNQCSDSLAEAGKTVRIRGAVSIARVANMERKRGWLITRLRGAAVVALACASLAGCASSTDVVASDKPGTYTVAASATGGRMAWARAHERAINEARDYCERRGMQSSVERETVSGISVMTEHGSSVSFECHPKF